MVCKLRTICPSAGASVEWGTSPGPDTSAFAAPAAARTDARPREIDSKPRLRQIGFIGHPQFQFAMVGNAVNMSSHGERTGTVASDSDFRDFCATAQETDELSRAVRFADERP